MNVKTHLILIPLAMMFSSCRKDYKIPPDNIEFTAFEPHILFPTFTISKEKSETLNLDINDDGIVDLIMEARLSIFFGNNHDPSYEGETLYSVSLASENSNIRFVIPNEALYYSFFYSNDRISADLSLYKNPKQPYSFIHPFNYFPTNLRGKSLFIGLKLNNNYGYLEYKINNQHVGEVEIIGYAINHTNGKSIKAGQKE